MRVRGWACISYTQRGSFIPNVPLKTPCMWGISWESTHSDAYILLSPSSVLDWRQNFLLPRDTTKTKWIVIFRSSESKTKTPNEHANTYKTRNLGDIWVWPHHRSCIRCRRRHSTKSSDDKQDELLQTRKKKTTHDTTNYVNTWTKQMQDEKTKL